MLTLPHAVLYAAWAVLLIGGFLFHPAPVDGGHRIPRAARMLSSLMLVLAALLSALAASPGMPFERAGYDPIFVLVAVGMAFGLLGDLFMARLIIRGDRYVLFGMGAFGLGHVAYIAAGLTALTLLAGDASPWPYLIGAWAAALALWYVVVARPARPFGLLHGAALPYALLLAATAGVFLAVTVSAGDAVRAPFALMTIGALLFLLSDLILAAQLFNGLRFRGIDDLIWLTYGPGQMAITLGPALLLTLV
ncbi:MAG: lysoplasmalogenase family protein [Candidatus Flexifilum sp.]|jgi:hypothetical protein